jgi:hypothetical protein
MISMLSIFADGVFSHRALDPDFDAEEGFRLLQTIVDAILTGRLDLNKAAPAPAPATWTDEVATKTTL